MKLWRKAYVCLTDGEADDRNTVPQHHKAARVEDIPFEHAHVAVLPHEGLRRDADGRVRVRDERHRRRDGLHGEGVMTSWKKKKIGKKHYIWLELDAGKPLVVYISQRSEELRLDNLD